MESGTATNFRLLRSLFDDRMNRLDQGPDDSAGVGAETEVVKTYILEFTDHSEPGTDLRQTLRETFTTPPNHSFKSLNVFFSGQDKLLQVVGQYRKKRVAAFVDFRDARFLRLHSTARSDFLDDLVRGWTARLPQLDHAWMDDQFLDWCSSLGDFRAIGIEFNNAPLTAPLEDTDDTIDDRAESIRLRQSGRPKDMLELLRGSGKFSEQSSLSMVKVKYPRTYQSLQITSEVRYDGRISGRGNSFVRHDEIAEQIIKRYRGLVLGLEQQFSRSARPVASGYVLTGKPFKIWLDSPIPDLETFCSRVFAAINPFRLAGIPRRVANNHYVVDAVDLHTAQTLRFELKPEAIWIVLPAGTCGNTLLRFVTNLKRHHSRLVRPDTIQGDLAGAL